MKTVEFLSVIESKIEGSTQPSCEYICNVIISILLKTRFLETLSNQ